MGNGIQSAIDSEFQKIYSIEISSKYYLYCMNRFRDFIGDKVFLYYGDSSKILKDIVHPINTTITFWLDGHWSGDDTGHGDIYYPLLQELDQIKYHPIKNHTLIIDDVRLFNTEWDLGLSIIQNKVLEINPMYKFTFEYGYIENDVMVATV